MALLIPSGFSRSFGGAAKSGPAATTPTATPDSTAPVTPTGPRNFNVGGLSRNNSGTADDLVKRATDAAGQNQFGQKITQGIQALTEQRSLKALLNKEITNAIPAGMSANLAKYLLGDEDQTLAGEDIEQYKKAVKSFQDTLKRAQIGSGMFDSLAGAAQFASALTAFKVNAKLTAARVAGRSYGLGNQIGKSDIALSTPGSNMGRLNQLVGGQGSSPTFDQFGNVIDPNTQGYTNLAALAPVLGAASLFGV